MNATLMFHRLALCFGLAAAGAMAQDSPPVQPFQATHLLWIDLQQPNAEKTVLAAMAEMNKAIVKAGCRKCVYHLWKVAGNQTGTTTIFRSHFGRAAKSTIKSTTARYTHRLQELTQVRVVRGKLEGGNGLRPAIFFVRIVNASRAPAYERCLRVAKGGHVE